MLRLTLSGRSSRVMRPHELVRGIRSLMNEEGQDEQRGALLEWISSAGVVLDRHRYASVAELAFILPSMLADSATHET